MFVRILAIFLALFLAQPSFAQQKKRIEKAADLPRFSYKVDGSLEDLLRDDAKFRAFATAVRRDTESVLADYDIPDKATQRQLLGVLTQLDFLDGRYDDALRHLAQVRELQEKPADKLLSGMQLRATIAAQRKAGDTKSAAYRAEVARLIAADLGTMPYAVVENDIKQSKARAELVGESLIMGNVREVLQPVVSKAGSLSSELAPGVVSARYALLAVLPLKQTLIDTYGTYLAAHKVDKPDIWGARSVTLQPGRGYSPVRIAIWDSGVDTALFRDRLVLDAQGKPALIAYDRYENPSSSELEPIPAELLSRLPQMKSRIKGFSDLQSNIDSAEASEVKQLLSTLPPDQYKSAIEEIRLAGNYMHGTHVSGIAMSGNPYARVLNARLEYGHTLLPDPCPSKELAERGVKATQAYVDFMRQNGVRVTNMSWGGSVQGYEEDLELCGIGKTPDERKAIAREYFDQDKAALTRAMAGAPEILFVAAAGNSNQDASFVEDIPADIVLPNLITVGAVDKAGDEASFTSYGPTVVVHANGYQVESTIPGGAIVAESGTSMAAPQVVNLAGKMLAVNPKLQPTELIAIIRETAEKTADGRRTLIDPAKAVAAAEAKRS